MVNDFLLLLNIIFEKKMVNTIFIDKIQYHSPYLLLNPPYYNILVQRARDSRVEYAYLKKTEHLYQKMM